MQSLFGKKGYEPVPEEGLELSSPTHPYELEPIPTDSRASNRASHDVNTCSDTLYDKQGTLKQLSKYILYAFITIILLVGIGQYVFTPSTLPLLEETNPNPNGDTSTSDYEDTIGGVKQVFDKLGRFIMRNYDIQKPMANFLAGIGGLWGVPMWVFIVNRGQGITSFGLGNKDGGIAGFQTAERAYQTTAFLGFRTFVKGQRVQRTNPRSGNSSTTRTVWQYQPFFPDADTGVVIQTETISMDGTANTVGVTASVVNSDLSDAPVPQQRTRNMHTGKNEIEIIEHEPTLGLTTKVLYHTTTDEDFPALIRKVTFTNTGPGSLELELLDGLAKLFPSGLTYGALNTMGRTLEAWMHVYNAGNGNSEIKQPFYHITQGFADTTTISIIKAGHFAMSFIEDAANLGPDGLYSVLSYVVDPTIVFGRDTAFIQPHLFW